MKLIKSTNQQCAAAAFAMAMDTTMEELFEALGHNGLDIIEPDLAEPACYRGFHPQEFIDYATQRGYAMTMFDLRPVMLHAGKVVDHSKFLPATRIMNALKLGHGIIFGALTGNRGHAVAWNRDEVVVYDPRGYTYMLGVPGNDFSMRQFFLLQKVEEHV